ncbi:hypothetical protein CTEN210_06531 [Chaetoceros tenuissimus]|uniref:Leucine-rich repeat domain-containing protein n=1 Tax=Chaetoceros tenuissimus TaxID=426638 RepID=A0AAD3CSI2_9STRA|nr:hypothetical protein CTEN210_06531 [Chaetoceros tenuissimus]
MRVQTEEWRRFIPGIRMYKGKKTLFWNGEPLYSTKSESDEPRIYDEQERESWKVLIVLPGVEVIPYATFRKCNQLETVIMSDSVRRIEDWAFHNCWSLVFIKLSRNLDYIGIDSFEDCTSLPSIFIPPSCREMYYGSFQGCKKLIILHVPQHTRLGSKMIEDTALIRASPFEVLQNGSYDFDINENVHEWIKI